MAIHLALVFAHTATFYKVTYSYTVIKILVSKTELLLSSTFMYFLSEVMRTNITSTAIYLVYERES